MYYKKNKCQKCLTNNSGITTTLAVLHNARRARGPKGPAKSIKICPFLRKNPLAAPDPVKRESKENYQLKSFPYEAYLGTYM
jgi:hypothetical protein